MTKTWDLALVALPVQTKRDQETTGFTLMYVCASMNGILKKQQKNKCVTMNP